MLYYIIGELDNHDIKVLNVATGKIVACNPVIFKRYSLTCFPLFALGSRSTPQLKEIRGGGELKRRNPITGKEEVIRADNTYGCKFRSGKFGRPVVVCTENDNVIILLCVKQDNTILITDYSGIIKRVTLGELETLQKEKNVRFVTSINNGMRLKMQVGKCFVPLYYDVPKADVDQLLKAIGSLLYSFQVKSDAIGNMKIEYVQRLCDKINKITTPFIEKYPTHTYSLYPIYKCLYGMLASFDSLGSVGVTARLQFNTIIQLYSDYVDNSVIVLWRTPTLKTSCGELKPNTERGVVLFSYNYNSDVPFHECFTGFTLNKKNCGSRVVFEEYILKERLDGLPLSGEEYLLGISNCSVERVDLLNSGYNKLAIGFYSNPNLKQVIFPKICNIRDAGFYQCYSLVEIKNSHNIKRLSGSSFLDCISLERIDLSGLTIYEKGVLYGIPNLKEVIVQERIQLDVLTDLTAIYNKRITCTKISKDLVKIKLIDI